MLLYRFATTALWPLLCFYTLRLALHYKSFKYFKQRLGFAYPKISGDIIWLHCASVGEVNTCLPLLNLLQKKYSNAKFLITTNTVTGEQTFLKHPLKNTQHCFLPVDFSGSTKRFIQKINPKISIILETEIWPHLYQQCAKQNIPLCIVNARLSHKTLNANHWLKSLYKQTLKIPRCILARSEKDHKYFIQLGANKKVIKTLGNLKFAHLNIALKNKLDIKLPSYTLLASSHHNEEYLLAELWKKENFNDLLVVVPRHPERGLKIEQELNKLGINTVRRSGNKNIKAGTQVYIADTLGELTQFMQDANIVIMGGSFIPHGGQNLLEAARLGKAILTGPHMFNFNDEMNLFLQKNACIQTTSIDDLKIKLHALYIDSNIKTELEHNALQLMQRCQNIPQLYADQLEKIIKC